VIALGSKVQRFKGSGFRVQRFRVQRFKGSGKRVLHVPLSILSQSLGSNTAYCPEFLNTER
jgi:hypothetical protein